jgi:hypothetical protein
MHDLASVAYIATITPVRELILAGAADLAYWRDRLAPAGLFPHDDGGRAAITLSAIAGRFRGLPFRECSVGVAVSERDGGPPEAVYLAEAFNSSRPLAWAERTFFRTPYQLAGIHLNEQTPVAASVTMAGQIILTMSMAAATEPPRHEAQAWEGRIFLPPNGQRRELFYARLAGPTDVYPFTPADTLTIRPGGDALRCLVESNFAAEEWRIRAAAVHARSRTYDRRTTDDGPQTADR